MDMTKRERRECLVLKVDFKRAYDKVNWSYLRYLFKRLAFGEKRKVWMEAYIFNSSGSILINGSVIEDFIRCPLSFFFILMEGLSTLMKKSVNSSVFNGFQVNENLSFEILQFADDTVIIGEGSMRNLWSVKLMLRGFDTFRFMC